MVQIYGSHFNEETVCVFDDHIEIAPIRDGSLEKGTNKIICEMPKHHATEPKSLNLKTWKNQHTIETGCTFKYHLDPSFTSVDP